MSDDVSSRLPSLPVEDLELVLASTRDCWEEARGKSFFITGGTGFFGIWLLETFLFINERLALGANAVVLSRSPSAFLQKAPHLAQRTGLRWLTGDVRNFEFPEGRFSYVIHAATSSVLIGNGTRDLAVEIVDATKHVLNFAEGARAEKLLFTSSGAAYGPQPESIPYLPEDYSGAMAEDSAKTDYGRGKWQSERLCMEQSGNPHCTMKIARCFAFVGPHLPLNGRFAIGNFIRDALLRQPISVQGDGLSVRSYLYAADLTVWLWTLLFHGRPNQIYNVGSSSAVTIAEVAGIVRSVTGSADPVRMAPQSVLRQAADRYVPAVALAERDLGLKEFVPLSEAVDRTFKWWKHALTEGYKL